MMSDSTEQSSEQSGYALWAFFGQTDDRAGKAPEGDSLPAGRRVRTRKLVNIHMVDTSVKTYFLCTPQRPAAHISNVGNMHARSR